VHMCTHPQQLRHLVDRALRISKGKRAVTCLVLPADVQEMDAEEPARAHGTMHSGLGYAALPDVAPEPALQQAAEVLNAGEKVAILAGAGALGAAAEVARVAEALGAGVAKALLGRAVLPDHLPYVTGSIGLLGTRPSWEMMRDCDTLLMIGSGFPYAEFLPKEGAARGVQIDIDPGMLSLRYPMEVNLAGDAAATLRALLPMLKPKPRGAWRETIEANVAEWWDEVDKRAHQSADPINPERLFWELSPQLPDNAIITADSGTSANWFARALKLREGMMASLSGGLATMCPAVPYATAAKFCHPDRVAIAFAGDGAMQLMGNSALLTAAKYWQRWQDPRMVVAVLNNGDLNQVTWELRAMGGYPRVEETQSVPPFNYAQYAELIGLKGIRVEDPEQLSDAWAQALSADRPVVIDAVVDPNVPTLPPHITYDQAKNYMTALIKGDANASKIVKQALKRALV
jgi:pyruvate dehydrogenase (quinone)